MFRAGDYKALDAQKGEIYWTEPDEDIMDVVAKTDEEITEKLKK
jgi:hypothetical protein